MAQYKGVILNEDFQLGSLIFNAVDEDDTLWVMNGVEGWWELSEPAIDDYPFPLGDGSYPSSGRYNARIITLAGQFTPSSLDTLPAARRKLLAATNLVRQQAWFMTHETDYTIGSVVQLSGKPIVSTNTTDGRTGFVIGLKAPDPIKYSLSGRVAPGWYTVSNSSSLTFDVTNEGDANVFPNITINGLLGGGSTDSSAVARIVNLTTGEALALKTANAIGDVMVIDNKLRAVTIDGTRNKRHYLTWDTDWITLAPGVNEFEIECGTASPNITFQYRHGWLG